MLAQRAVGWPSQRKRSGQRCQLDDDEQEDQFLRLESQCGCGKTLANQITVNTPSM